MFLSSYLMLNNIVTLRSGLEVTEKGTIWKLGWVILHAIIHLFRL